MPSLELKKTFFMPTFTGSKHPMKSEFCEYRGARTRSECGGAAAQLILSIPKINLSRLK
jgi:hypothetical protein